MAISNALCSRDYKGPRPEANEGAPVVVCYENHAQDSRVKDCGDLSPQLNAKSGTGGNNLPLVASYPVESREVSPTLTAKMQGSSVWAPHNETEHLIPMAESFDGDIARSLTARHDSSPCADRGMNVVAVGVDLRNGRMTGDVAQTLQAHHKSNSLNAEPTVAIGVDVYNHVETGDVAATLGMNSGQCNTAGPKVIAFKPGSSADARSIGAQEEIACTLEGGGGGNNKQAVAYRTTGNCGAWPTGDKVDALTTQTDPNAHVLTVAPSLTASNDPSRSPQSSEVTQQVEAVYASSMAVRRLTPTECERLQGFPDNYTKISDKTADGPRYKALGNSMAVPVMKWIGKRIKMVGEL